ERYQIEALCKLDYSARSVPLQLGRSNKTISNELSRFEGRIYCAHTAHQQSFQRSSTAKKTSKKSATGKQTRFMGKMAIWSPWLNACRSCS
ncbi:MAG: IS30 family transposase, partial [Oleiphilaceae bacterium]